MRIGIFGGDVAATGTIDDHVAAARRAADDGFTGFWLPQIFGYDALTVLALIGREVPGIELGTAVVPTYPRPGPGQPAYRDARLPSSRVPGGPPCPRPR